MASQKAEHYISCAAKSQAHYVRVRSYDIIQLHAALQSVKHELGSFIIVGAHQRLHTYHDAVRQFGTKHVYRAGMSLNAYDTIICIYLKPYHCCDTDVLKYVIPLLQTRTSPRLWIVSHPNIYTNLMSTLDKWYDNADTAYADLHLAKL